jgi:hypothetical protein
VEDGFEMSLGDGKWLPEPWVPTKESCTCSRQEKRQVYKPNIEMEKQVNLAVIYSNSKQWYKSTNKW